LMERFLVRHLGHAEMARWTAASAEVFAIAEEDTGSGAAGVVDRLRRQLENYASDLEVTASGRTFAAIRVRRCGIWDYRERAQAAGVQLTLESPCEFCTKATAANFRAKGYRPEYELIQHESEKGCWWSARKDEEDAGSI
jgi:hypothetical protein